jgi:predicted membrane protein
VISQYFRRLDGSLYLSKEKQEFILTTTIKDVEFNPSILSGTTFEKYLDLNSIALDQMECSIKLSSEGIINGHCKFIAPKFKSRDNHMLFDSNIIESSFQLSDGFNQIDLKPFKLNYPEGMVGIHFTSDEAKKKSELQFTGTQINIDQAKEMSLLLFKDNEITKTIFQIILNGIVPQIIVSFQSKDLKDLFYENNFTLKGTIEDGSVHIPETDLIASRVFGSVSIHNGVLDINTNTAVIQKSKIKKGVLSIDLFNYKDFPFQGEFLLDVDLSTIPHLLTSLLPDTLLARELTLVHDVTGRTKAKLNLSLETCSNDLKVKIDTDDFSATGKYDRIPGNITLENIKFAYEPDKISLSHLTGVVNSSSIYDLNMAVDFKDEKIITIQSGSGMIHLESMIPWLMSYQKTKAFLSPVKEATGTIHVTSMDLTGPLLEPDQWEYDLKGMGLGINVTTHLNQKQIENLSCQYHISDDLIDLKKIHLKMKNLLWIEPFVEKKYRDSILVPFDMENGNFHMSTKQCIFNSDLKFTTGPELNIDLKGETISSLALNSIKFLDKGLSNGSVSFHHNKDVPLYNFSGILDTTTLNKLIIPDSFWAKKIDFLTDGQSILLYTDKDSILNIITKNIDLNSLLSQSRKFNVDTCLLPNNSINFKTDKLKIKEMTLSNFDSTISFKKNHLYVRIKRAEICDLKASGYINLKKDMIFADFPIEANNKANIQDLLTCLLPNPNRFMDGHYSLTGNIGCNGPKKDFLNHLAGSIILKAEKGRIYKLTLLSRILSVLNISKFFKGNIPNITQEGFAYNNISIEADIKDSTIFLTKAVIDGHDMTLVFKGWIDPINDKINLTCLVAPFKTVDLIIKYIPIINTLLGGRLVSVPVKAAGKLSDPIVTPLHPSAVGTGLVNMMSTILKTPVKLWDKIYGE